jgi:hypothetical protein
MFFPRSYNEPDGRSVPASSISSSSTVPPVIAFRIRKHIDALSNPNQMIR